MAPESLALIKKLDAERTQGEWRVFARYSGAHNLQDEFQIEKLAGGVLARMTSYHPAREDARFIAACSVAVPELIAEVERLRSALESVIAASHSWVIREESAYVLKPVHDRFREIAREALAGKEKG